MRKNRGNASHNEFSITAKPHLASSCGVGRSCRTSSLCHASAISRSSVGTSIGRCASVLPIASYFITSVRLSTSVGCAVSTSSICSAAIAASSPGSSGNSTVSPACAATWCCCSAMLARFRNWLNARATSVIASAGIDSSRALSASHSGAAAGARGLSRARGCARCARRTPCRDLRDDAAENLAEQPHVVAQRFIEVKGRVGLPSCCRHILRLTGQDGLLWVRSLKR